LDDKATWVIHDSIGKVLKEILAKVIQL